MPSLAVITALSQSFQCAGMKFESEAKKDLLIALDAFPDLSPMTTYHVFPDGINRLCCSLVGTIPITYKGTAYHIPVSLYLLENHPYAGPYCYVRPTAGMRIRPSELVNGAGRVNLPYLADWRYPQCDTAALLQVMVFTFQENCPVFAIPTTSPALWNFTIANNNQPQPVMPAANACAIGTVKIVDSDGFKFTCSVAGYTRDELSVELDGDVVLISGEHKHEGDGQSPHRTFTRRVLLPNNVNTLTLSCTIDGDGQFELKAALRAVEPKPPKVKLPIHFKESNNAIKEETK